MNCFERHGIKHLSASSLALYRNQPSLFVLQYLYGVKGEAGPAAWRGSAVEAGVDLALYWSDEGAAPTLAKALERFELDALGDMGDEVVKERQNIEPILAQAVEIMKPHGMPTARQYKIEHWLDGIEVPVIGYVDYLYPGKLIDLKTTLRMPSEPRPDHAVQVSLYHKATGREPLLAYVTPKKACVMPLTDEQITTAMWTVNQSAKAVRALLSAVESKEQAASLFVPDFSSFYWNEAMITEALHVWR